MARSKKRADGRYCAQTYLGRDADGGVQMGINMAKMMENQKALAAENLEVFGTGQPQCFTNPRIPRGDELVMEAHKAARAVIHELFPDLKVGLTLSLHDIQPLPGGEAPAQKDWDDEFTHYLPATADDARRVAFIDEALAGVQRCMADGIPVKGYFYWSLMDNFAWQKGFAMQFGLIAVDRATQRRIPKPSLAHLGIAASCGAAVKPSSPCMTRAAMARQSCSG